jgi:hypothetical protein
VRLVEREGRVVEIALAETDFVCGFRAGDDDLLDAEFAGGFDDVVGTSYVASVTFVVLGVRSQYRVRIKTVDGGCTGTNMFRA